MPEPAEGVEVRVGGVAVMAYVEVYEPESIACVRDVSVTEKEMDGEVASAYVPSVATVEVSVHVPALTNATSPDELLTVQTPVVDDAYVSVPLPAEGVDVRVGGVAVIAYVEVYDSESITCVRARGVTAKEMVLAVAES